MAENLNHRLRVTAQTSIAVTLLAAGLSIAGCKSATPAPNPGPAPAANQAATPENPSLAPNSGATGTQPASNQPDARIATPAQNPPPPPQPAPPLPPPPPLVAPAGTRVVVRTTESLSASHNDVGDRFSGELAQAIVSHGATVFPQGTRVEGTVVASKKRGRFKGAGDLGIEINTIGGIHAQTSEYERDQKGKGKRTGALVGGGAGLGALIGGLAGGGKGAVIGGLAGAGAGTAGAAYTGNKDDVIPSESVVSFSLTAPLTVPRHSAR